FLSIKKGNEKFVKTKADFEKTCETIQIGKYSYKSCAGSSDTYRTSFSPIGVCDNGMGQPDCIDAVRVWDKSH
ncbi:MAG: hypothetical protein JWO73_807, partial [Candidatus Taylorbacteria bacterium]|nr:hypothetical protein [Candidatus Taylorbacteria bacterium]